MQRFIGFLLLLTTLIPNANAELTRILYSDDHILKEVVDTNGQPDLKAIEQALDARVVVLHPEKPSKPRYVQGIVLHNTIGEDGDDGWIIGDENPNLDQAQIEKSIISNTPGVKDLQDKVDEHTVMLKIAAKVAPPELLAGGDPLLLAERSDSAEIEKKVNEAVNVRKEDLLLARIDQVQLRNDLIRIETFRRNIDNLFGKALVKRRKANHSEGKLPKTNKDWINLYINYSIDTLPKIRQIEAEIKGTDLSLDHEVIARELDYLEGRVLEAWLVDPNSTCTQKMVKIKTEVRVHIYKGKIVEGATFLRFYSPGKYLKESELKDIHHAIQTQFLDLLPSQYKEISLTPDVIIEENGKISILDPNFGTYSGYLQPEEDLFTANLYSSLINNRQTPFQTDWSRVVSENIGDRKTNQLSGFLNKYKDFMHGDVLEAYWDRIIRDHMNWLKRGNPNLAKDVIFSFKRAGLKSVTIYHQFISELQDRFPMSKIWSEEDRQEIIDFLNALDPCFQTIQKDGRLILEIVENCGQKVGA